MLRLIETVYSYDAWATDRLLDSLKELTPEEYREEVASRHGSLCQTFAHMLAVEWRFFSWLDGSVPAMNAFTLELDGDEIATISAARCRWEMLKEQVAWVIASLSEPALSRVRTGTFPNGVTFRLPLANVLLHVVTHNIHTRAQIEAAMQRLNRRTGKADLLRYAARMQKPERLAFH